MSKSKKQAEDTESIEERQRRHELLKGIILFPGSVQEYERFRGYEVEIVDTQNLQDKGVRYGYLFDDALQDSENRINNRRLAKLLIQDNVEALVNVSSSIYGLPVKRKPEHNMRRTKSC